MTKKRKKKPKRRVRKGLVAVLVLLLLIALALPTGFLWYSRSLKAVNKSAEAVSVEIAEGESYDAFLESLESQDLIRSALAAKIYARLHNETGQMYTGVYTLSSSMSTPEILEYVADPANLEQTYAVVTIPEGYWAKQIAEVLAAKLPQYTAQEFLDLWNDETYIETLAASYSFLDPEVLDNPDYFVKLEGYLYPETYYVDYDLTPDQITRMFLNQFEVVYDQYKAQIEASPYTLQELLTLASIVQFESGDTNEMPVIAEVFYNRLELGMPLQSSVTVCYALYDEFESATDCETNTTVDSPYNTYVYDGIPIGPILNPGKEAIAAVLNPDENDYLYFVADIYGDGSVHYATTYEEHEANVDKYNLRISQ